MPDPIAKQIVTEALAANEMQQMLIGRPPYTYRPRWSPAPPGETDITIVLDSLYDEDFSLSRIKLRTLLESTIVELTKIYDGLIPAASCLLFETVRRSGGSVDMELPLDDLANLLKDAVQIYMARWV